MIVVLAFGAVLLSPWAAAAEQRFTIHPGQMPRVAALPLDLVARLWNLVDRALTKNGAWIDPNGGKTSGQGSNPTADTGCSPDPNGCGKTGASIDPNGGNAPGQGSNPTADTGSSLDPHGG